MKIEEVIRAKGTDVVTIAPTATVDELVALLAEHNIGAAVVSHDGVHIDGMVSERDIVRFLALNQHGLLSRSVSELMTSEVSVATPEDRIEDTAHTMTKRRVRHVPVLIDGRLHAIVSIGDIVKHRIDQLTDERNALLGYLHTQ